MAVRLATVQDVPRILEIYGPYIENTAISFEYTVPGLEEFTERFLGITAQKVALRPEERKPFEYRNLLKSNFPFAYRTTDYGCSPHLIGRPCKG